MDGSSGKGRGSNNGKKKKKKRVEHHQADHVPQPAERLKAKE